MFMITDLYMPLKGFIYKNQHLSKLNNRNRSIWAFALNLENFTQHYANNFLYCIDSAGKKINLNYRTAEETSLKAKLST